MPGQQTQCDDNCRLIWKRDQADHDNDGVPDDCDICPGSDDTLDANTDGVPDGCDACPGFDDALDCDADGTPDGCETDCQPNGVPDDCELPDCLPGDPACDDCNDNGIPDECDIDDGTADANGNGIPDECEVEPPGSAPAPHDILKNRYISIDPRGTAGNNPASHHIRVMMDSSEVNGLVGSGPWWATDPVNGQSPSPATCVSVVSAIKPADEPDWSGCPTLHLTGCPIVPTTTYAIAAEVAGALSPDALFDTQAKPGVKWLGDVVGMFTGPAGIPPNVWTAPNGTVNIDDAFAAIKTFIDPNATNATHLSVTDMHPVLNGVQMTLLVNINDALIVIKGFQGNTYGEVSSPFPDDGIPDLTQCP